MHPAIVPLASIARSPAAPAACPSAASGACGGGAVPADLPAPVWDKVKDHPCYSEQAHHYFARMHVAVAPACNIQCNYCNRKYACAAENRPGVVARRLEPAEARDQVLAVAAEMPQLSVVGIAGPGDSLANPRRTFETFRLIAKAMPDLKLCLSTNGLALPDHVEAIRALNVDHVTVTINALEPEIAARIYAWIYWNKKRLTGIEAARVLVVRQLDGLQALAAAGVLVKVNSVLIPGINDEHLPELSRTVMARGAFLHNIMPLIARSEHGTRFGLDGRPEPTAEELLVVQEACGGARLMRHCKQCRADAIGMLGEDRRDEFTPERLAARAAEGKTTAPDARVREAYRRFVEKERRRREAARDRLREGLAELVGGRVVRIAVATKGGNRVNQHFGHTTAFEVYEVSAAGVRHLGSRRADNYCQGGHGDDERWPAILEALAGCEAVLVSKIGRGPVKRLAANGIRAVEDHALQDIEEAALAYLRAVAAAESAPVARGAA
jgi:nitrogen fixation protein NifB